MRIPSLLRVPPDGGSGVASGAAAAGRIGLLTLATTEARVGLTVTVGGSRVLITPVLAGATVAVGAAPVRAGAAATVFGDGEADTGGKDVGPGAVDVIVAGGRLAGCGLGAAWELGVACGPDAACVAVDSGTDVLACVAVASGAGFAVCGGVVDCGAGAAAVKSTWGGRAVGSGVGLD
jgi:hypothetical protein